jgi:cell division septum initiation protein DivIVA
MNSFHRPHGGLHETDAPQEATRSPFADIAGRFANWMTGADRLTLDEAAMRPEPYDRDLGLDDDAPLPAAPPVPPVPPAPPAPADESSRFPLAPFGYNRTAVDEQLARLERELDELRSKREPLGSITDELERIGEQTASILVVAHDQAHQTTRMAQEQADRCVADAAANAVAMTEDAKQRLRDLDNETDAIWRERERLLEDVRGVSAALANLADQASDRFPAAEPGAPAAAAFPAVGATAHRAVQGIWEQAASEPAMPPMAQAREPQPTEPFDAFEESGEDGASKTQPGDAGSWLTGLEPPDLLD